MKETEEKIRAILQIAGIAGLMGLIMAIASGCGQSESAASSNGCCCCLVWCTDITKGANIAGKVIPYAVAALIIAMTALFVIRKVRIANIKTNVKVAKVEATQAKKLMRQGIDAGNLEKPAGIPIKRNIDQFDKKDSGSKGE